jgi:glycosyltransferase involved in cell wall biosynthesis
MNSREADICIIVEGSYPYVTGGVASWVQGLISAFNKKFTFSVVALTAGKKEKKDLKYKLPDNVISFHSFDIFDYSRIKEALPVKIKNSNIIYSLLYKIMMYNFSSGNLENDDKNLLKFILSKYKEGFFKFFLTSELGFTLLNNIYIKKHYKNGFLKYYYNWRNIHLVLWRVFMITNNLPAAKIYHSPSAGFAGFLSCLMTALYNKPSIITEHGIYIQEREIELSVAGWLDEFYLQKMWINCFKSLTKWEYKTVTKLITLYQGNKQLEIKYGADEKKIDVIPNGIKISRFISARRTRLTSNPPIIGIVARVDPVKDIKTFIQVIANIKQFIHNIKSYVVGPTEEYYNYYNECIALRDMLNLEDNIIFTGRADVVKYYKKMDVLLLTSIKEAMPLVIMEGMASGLPVVSTRVGACEELIYGIDDGIGPAGYVATVMNVQDIALKTIKILKNKDMANQMAKNGIERIEKFYREENVRESYENIYKSLLK